MPHLHLIAVDDHPAVLRGIAAELAALPDEFELVATYTHPEQVDLASAPVDVVVLDVRLDADGVSTSLPWIAELVAWGAKVLLHTSEERPVQLRRAMDLGACGVCLKVDDALVDALRQIRDDGQYVSSEWADVLLNASDLLPALTSREVDVLEGLQDGLDRRLVARRLGISLETVRTYLTSATKKYRELRGTKTVTNSIALLREARRDGWVDPR